MTRFRTRIALSCLGVALIAAGCASPPEAEQKAAQAAAAAARAAGADKYAAKDFGALTDALKKADGEMANKAYKEAKESYEKVKGLGEQATKAAVTGKAAMKAEVEKAIGEVEKRWQEVSAQAKAASKSMKKDAAAAWAADAKAVDDSLKAAKDAVANDALAAKDKLAAATAAIDKWAENLKTMAAAKMPAGKAPAKAPQVKKP
jgi:colicin import membrane protein